jgi:WD40 repeat protein
MIASGAYDGSVVIWDTERGALMYTLNGHTGVVRSVLLIDENTIASCASDNCIKLWDLSTRLCNDKLEGHTAGVLSIELIDIE